MILGKYFFYNRKVQNRGMLLDNSGVPGQAPPLRTASGQGHQCLQDKTFTICYCKMAPY